MIARGDLPTVVASHGVAGYWRIVLVLTLIYMYAFVDRVILALLVDPVRTSLGASDVQMGLLLGVAFAGLYCLCNVPAGYFADRTNRRQLMAAASVIWALMTILCGTAHSFTQLLIARMGVGIAESVVAPVSFSLIRDAVPSRSRALAFSIYGMAPMIGGAVSLTGGGLLLKAAGNGAFHGVPLLSGLEPWQCTMVILGMLGLPLGLLPFVFREPARLGGSASYEGGILAAISSAGRFMIQHRRTYLPLLTFAAFGAMMSFASTAWLPAAMSRHWHLAPKEIGPPMGIMTLIGGIVGLSFGGWIMNRSVRRGGTTLGYGIIGVSGTALGVAVSFAAPTLNLAYVGIQITFLFIGVSYAAGATTLSEVTPLGMMGRVSALYLMVQTLVGQSGGPFIVAFASKTFFEGPADISRSLSVTLAGFAAVCIVSALTLIRRHRLGALKPTVAPA
jgi:MFS transporter, Spinster family, sphingosine-1-phosphate transporter